jgi:hypothetical protein
MALGSGLLALGGSTPESWLVRPGLSPG